ncbi:MAG TPA: EAL domain-containing protein [Chromatiaceae bacterium]|nr:EAL domain-containing protein [Chromatiaceae bacterium]
MLHSVMSEASEVTFFGGLALLPAGLLFSFFLWRRRKGVAKQFLVSWQRIFIASMLMNLGFTLNLLPYLPAPEWPLPGSASLFAAIKYSSYLIALGLFFSGVRQWYPLILSVQQEAMAQAAFYRRLTQGANSVFLRWNLDGKIISINPYGERLFGYRKGELKGRSVMGTIVPKKDSRGRDLEAMIQAIRENPDAFHYNENENITRDGRSLWLAWRNTLIEEGPHGEPEVLSVAVDITDRKRVEDALHALASTTDQGEGGAILEEMIKHLAWAYGVQYAFYATFADDTREQMKVHAMWNGDSITSGHVYSLEGTPCADVLSGKIHLIEKGVAERYPGNSMLTEWGVESYYGVSLRHPQGETIGIIGIMDVRPMELTRWNRYLLKVFGSRIGGELQRRYAEENIYQLAHYDILTGLPNRLLFQDRLEQALAHAQRNNQYVALLFIDLDRFKHVNDTLGHAGGDILLRMVSERLTALLRSSDTVSRLGGDEFIILMTDFVSEAQMNKVTTELSRKLIEVIAEPFHIHGSDMFISASIGITCYPTDGMNIDYLIRNADLAMYKAKERGRNCFEFYRPQLNELAERRSRLEAELRNALSRRELRLHYQPIVDLANLEVAGFEALVRWQHPTQGLVLPGEFIDVAEESGLVRPIGEWVIEESCRQLKAWAEVGTRVGRISINLSLRQLAGGALLDQLQSSTRKYGIRPEQIMFEITESTLMHDPERTVPLLEELEAHGHSMAMDDFGTGYSSLAQLRQLPVKTLKIDRSFIRGLPEDRSSVKIVSAIIGLGRGLGLEVIAEGVETPQQHAYLQQFGCQLVQGHLLGAPMEAETCIEYLANPHSWQKSLPAL